jgi:hypothetical protein
MIAQLDAAAACLYRPTERQLAHVFEAFHEGWDYELRLRSVVKDFKHRAQPRPYIRSSRGSP